MKQKSNLYFVKIVFVHTFVAKNVFPFPTTKEYYYTTISL